MCKMLDVFVPVRQAAVGPAVRGVAFGPTGAGRFAPTSVKIAPL
jgi:hypothetical protein